MYITLPSATAYVSLLHCICSSLPSSCGYQNTLPAPYAFHCLLEQIPKPFCLLDGFGSLDGFSIVVGSGESETHGFVKRQ